MSTKKEEIDPEVEKLIAEQADEQNIPEDLLKEIYVLEKEMVTMDRRAGLPSELRQILEYYVDNGWSMES
jgi:hypothetical protein